MSQIKDISCGICNRIIGNAELGKDGTIRGIGCNNPFPIRYRVCCDSCNNDIVIPLREKISNVRNIVENDI